MLFLIMLAYISTPCLLNFGCYFSIHYIVNMMVYKVQLMFYGNVKWPLRNDGKGFTYFQIQLLVWGGIMPYLLFCCIARSFCSTSFSYMISSVWSYVGISLCITIEVRWNVSFCFLYVHFSSNILRCIFLSKNKKDLPLQNCLRNDLLHSCQPWSLLITTL